jgi:DNA-binding response OmpR family regulator
MTKRAVYMSNGSGADPAIRRGLIEAGYEVVCTHGIAETLSQLQIKETHMSADPTYALKADGNVRDVVLVAEVQAGAIPLLTLLREQGVHTPPTLVFDREGSDIRIAIKALQLGVRDYLLASDPEVSRELCACVLARHQGGMPHWFMGLKHARQVGQAGKVAGEFQWDAKMHVVRMGAERLRLSPIEGRIFDLLFTNRGHVVTVTDFVVHALKKPELDPLLGARQLRPHLMRLRRKLGHYPLVANRIVNTRGSGYMLV